MSENKGYEQSRRRVLAVSGAMALALALPRAAAAQPAPKKGGRFQLWPRRRKYDRFAQSRHRGTGALTNIGLWGAVYNNLMEVGADGKLTPELSPRASNPRRTPKRGPSSCARASPSTTARR